MFSKKDGYYIIIAEGVEYFSRSHPEAMYSSMLLKEHDRFMVFKDSDEDETEIITIEQLKNYIKEVKQNV